MKANDLHKEIEIYNNILPNHEELFIKIKNETIWDKSMHSRKTISYGVPYNYSNMFYNLNAIPSNIEEILFVIEKYLGFKPNNCLVNYYETGFSKMGFHSDQIDLLHKNTGIAIISLGNERIMRFKDKNRESVCDFVLKPNSLFYMSMEVQKYWLHSILPDQLDSNKDRISLTFRKIKL